MVSRRRRRKKKKKIEIGKKEFKYRGKTLEELKELTLEELLPLLPSRARRTLKRGLTPTQNKLLNDVENTKPGEPIRTHCRNMVILPSFVGHQIHIHDGQDFKRIDIKPEMIGHYLGEFSMTRKEVKHTGPGLGATRSSKFMPLK
ncbi:MAG: 30S ribosomal protein S19 [Candidatus Thermoplasmatota archaeon]